jgi:hypothetical protein
VVEHLPSKCKALNSNPRNKEGKREAGREGGKEEKERDPEDECRPLYSPQDHRGRT